MPSEKQIVETFDHIAADIPGFIAASLYSPPVVVPAPIR